MAPTETTFPLGRFLIRIGIRPDNPAFPVFLVFCGSVLIGRQFSRPSEADCEWLEREKGYAEPDETSSFLYRRRQRSAAKGLAKNPRRLRAA